MTEEFKLIHEEHLYKLFAEIGQKIIEDAKTDRMDDETRMLLTMGCEGVLDALSAAPSWLIGTSCSECGKFARIPPSTKNIDPPAHSVVLAGSGAKLCCLNCGHQLAEWIAQDEKWARLPGKQDTYVEALKLMLSNQQRLLICARDAFQSRDALIELIRVLQQNGTLNEEELGDQRHLLSMQLLPERTYRELISRESEVLEHLVKLEGKSNE